MKKRIILLLTVFLVGCGTGEDIQDIRNGSAESREIAVNRYEEADDQSSREEQYSMQSAQGPEGNVMGEISQDQSSQKPGNIVSVQEEYREISVSGIQILREDVIPRKIDTRSEYDTSFRKKVGEDMDVLYLGMPMQLSDEGEEWSWSTTDPTVATVENGVVTGWREGIVYILQHEKGGDAPVNTWEFAVTTFNDGKQADVCYEVGTSGLWNEGIEYYHTVAPELLKVRINTIQDAIIFFQQCNFYKEEGYLEIGTDSGWKWGAPAKAYLLNRRGTDRKSVV